MKIRLKMDRMQRLKLKRIKKKSDMPKRNTIQFMNIVLNEQAFDIAEEKDGRIIITNHDNDKVYELINEIT